jgi:hypothetical protein
MMQDWLKAGFGLWWLSGEIAVVLALRGLKMSAGGPAAVAEMQRMVTEKMAAAITLQSMAWRGGLGATMPAAVERSTRYYRKRVRANRRRLSGI